jgi:hypothetical protein
MAAKGELGKVLNIIPNITGARQPAMPVVFLWLFYWR